MERDRSTPPVVPQHHQRIRRFLRQHRLPLILVAALLVVGQHGETDTRPGDADPLEANPAVATAQPARFTPVAPTRVLDTRVSSRAQAAMTSTTLDLSSSVPADATAVTLTVTMTNTTGPGFVTVWPSGQQRPLASSINASHSGQTIANLVTVLLGTGQRIDFYSHAGADIVVDLAGFYQTSGPTTAGRFIPLQTRAVDTRDRRGAMAAGSTLAVDLTKLGDLYEQRELIADASAVAVNLTVVDAQVGFWSLYPSGSDRPSTSNANVDTKGRITANMAVVAVNDARFTVFTQNGGHLVVDVLGFFTGSSAPESTDGLFVATAPTRLLDTRSGRQPVPDSSLSADLDGFLAGTGYDPTKIAALDTNTTITETPAPGFFTVYPGRYPFVPPTSSLNATSSGTTVANHVTAPITQGGISIYTQSGGHVVVDVTGFYLGEPVECRSCLPRRDPRVGGSSDWYPATPATIGAAWTDELPVWFAPDAAVFELDEGIMVVGLYDGLWRAYLVSGAVTFTVNEETIWNHIFIVTCPDGLIGLWAIVSTDYNDIDHPYYQRWRERETEATC